MNQYETVFILTPVLSDDQAKATSSSHQRKKPKQEKGSELTFFVCNSRFL